MHFEQISGYISKKEQNFLKDNFTLTLKRLFQQFQAG